MMSYRFRRQAETLVSEPPELRIAQLRIELSALRTQLESERQRAEVLTTERDQWEAIAMAIARGSATSPMLA